ncbi:MAG: hypothetical protein M1539_00405 [Actinobacteria bacterium]|nr:hypothetical protein [Actinomycetota bacterium]MCL5882438.1 hypothetical protein [Actinomycetota bacterium]
MKKAVIATIIFLLVLASPFLVNAASGKLFNPDTKPDLTAGTDADAKQCVEPVGGTRQETKDYMRLNHQQLLKDERVKVVREGNPTPGNRLTIEACFTCHNYKDFCQQCHSYNGVEPGCFDQTGGCHSTEEDRLPRPQGF